MFSRLQAVALVAAGGLWLAGCSAPAPNQAPAGGVEITEPGQVPDSAKVVIAVLGDSITAGLGLTTLQAYPALLQDLFRAEGYDEVEVDNGGVSGDTTAGGLRRTENLIAAANVRILVVALGGNDALRGLSVSETRENLRAIINQARGKGIGVMLAGMEGPTNLGEDYRAAFRAVYANLAREYGREVVFVPFLLEGVGGNPALNQEDGMHPTAQGASVIAQLLYPRLRDMVDQLPDPAIFEKPQ